MALLLAPYNNAMQLGMGFNSFTQQLCVNDAVQKPAGVKATEEDLISKSPIENGQPAAGVPQHVPSSETTPNGHPKVIGGTFTRLHRDNSQAEISQIVTWSSSFINNISDVTTKMDIAGSLLIKIDAIGGGAKAKANYLDMDTVKKSDVSYHLQVNVINQKLVGDDVTEFMPIKNVQPTQFNDVYGDCFVSGFLEGGVFDAIISIELENKSLVKNFGGELAIQAKFAGGAVEIEGQGEGKKEASDNKTNDKISVSVSWSGGGDIISRDVERKGWTMETLKATAMSFADKVALCPQRTSAILTKYSSLRSYYEKSLHGSPLDYENAGIYSSALLDAYMDYKLMWRELQSLSRDVTNIVAVLTVQVAPTELALMVTSSKEDYDAQVKEYDATLLAFKSNEGALTQYNAPARTSTKIGLRKPEKPLPPNPLVPYSATIFGLDQAQRDCRFEMIKIVREVDAVAEDPHVAVDPLRNNQYLSPVVFKCLLPSPIKIDPVALLKKNEELNASIITFTKDLNDHKTSLKNVESERDLLSTKVEEGEVRVKERDGKIASISRDLEKRNQDLVDQKASLDNVKSEREAFSTEVKTTRITVGLRDETILSVNKDLKKAQEAVFDFLKSRKDALSTQIDKSNETLRVKDDTIANLHTEIEGLKKSASNVAGTSIEKSSEETVPSLTALQGRLAQLEEYERNAQKEFPALHQLVEDGNVSVAKGVTQIAKLNHEHAVLVNEKTALESEVENLTAKNSILLAESNSLDAMMRDTNARFSLVVSRKTEIETMYKETAHERQAFQEENVGLNSSIRTLNYEKTDLKRINTDLTNQNRELYAGSDELRAEKSTLVRGNKSLKVSYVFMRGMLMGIDPSQFPTYYTERVLDLDRTVESATVDS